MNRKILTLISFLLVVLGILGRAYAASYTYVDTNGILRDSLLLPIGTLLFLLGFLGLVGIGCMTLWFNFREK